MALSKAQISTITKAKKILEEHALYTTNALTSPSAARDYVIMHLAAEEHEVFTVFFLTTQHQVIAAEDMFKGTIDGCSVYPREVAKRALEHNAGAVIFAHNHPSGVSDPSQADKDITKRLKEGLALFDIRVLDHLIVAGAQVTSFAERGLL